MTDTVLSASKLDELLSKGAWDARPGPGATFSLSITAIAAGAEPAGAGKLKLSVTLVMQPVVGSAYDLAKLPTAIAEQAGDIDIVLISSEGEKLVAAKLTVGNVSTEDATIGDLWRRLMAPNGGVDWWHETAKQLPLAKPETEGGAPKTPPPIIPVPRGEAAVSLVLRRAKRVRDRRDIIKTPGTKPGSDLDGGNELDMVVGFDGRTKISQEELEKTARDRIRKTVVGFVKTEIASAKELMNKLKANIKLDEAANEAIGACRLSSDETKSPSDMAMAVCDGNSEKCKNRNAVQRSLHYAATAEDGTKPPDGTTKNAEAAQRRLMALDALPRLARLFNLVVDGHVVIDMVALGGATWKEKFVSVTAKLPEADGADNVWTQAKISKADEGNAIGPQFWPCTQEELDAASLAGGCTDVFRPAISQRNGIMDLGVTESKGAITSPRYDIATVDTIAGVEGEMNQELAKATRKENNVGEDPGGDGAITLRTVGLCLVDRWRRDTAIKTVLRAAECRALSGATLDADALQIGWRLDVGTEGAGGKIVWRSLCNRFVDQHWVVEFECLDAGRNLSDLLRAVRPGIPVVGLETAHGQVRDSELGHERHPFELRGVVAQAQASVRANAASPQIQIFVGFWGRTAGRNAPEARTGLRLKYHEVQRSRKSPSSAMAQESLSITENAPRLSGCVGIHFRLVTHWKLKDVSLVHAEGTV